VAQARAPAPSNQPLNPQANANLSPMPVTLRLDSIANLGVSSAPTPPAMWNPTADRDLPPNGAATANQNWTTFNSTNQSGAWQLPGQWILDKFSNVHQVISGRRVAMDGPVRLARPMPETYLVPPVAGQAAGTATGPQPSSLIDQIWYLPGRDANGNTIIPVFCTVQEL